MSQELSQFFHNDTAAVERGKRGKKPLAEQILNEFTRTPGFEAHVKKSRLPKKPVPPITHFDAIPKEAYEAFEAEARAAGKTEEADLRPSHPVQALPAYLRSLMAQAAAKNGRKMQRNSQVLLCPVISYPKTIKQVIANGAKEFATYRSWIRDCIEFAKEEWGEQFVFCGEHVDESNGHLHIYGVPKWEGNKLTLGLAHPGQEANRVNKTGQREAYDAAMEAQQDRFYARVSVKYGHLRISSTPGPRLTRREWKMGKELKEARAEIERLEALIDSSGHGKPTRRPGM